MRSAKHYFKLIRALPTAARQTNFKLQNASMDELKQRLEEQKYKVIAATCTDGLASSPGHSQILSIFLHGYKIKSGSGLGMRL